MNLTNSFHHGFKNSSITRWRHRTGNHRTGHQSHRCHLQKIRSYRRLYLRISRGNSHRQDRESLSGRNSPDLYAIGCRIVRSDRGSPFRQQSPSQSPSGTRIAGNAQKIRIICQPPSGQYFQIPCSPLSSATRTRRRGRFHLYPGTHRRHLFRAAPGTFGRRANRFRQLCIHQSRNQTDLPIRFRVRHEAPQQTDSCR